MKKGRKKCGGKEEEEGKGDKRKKREKEKIQHIKQDYYEEKRYR
jgi:hypothetical protein